MTAQLPLGMSRRNLVIASVLAQTPLGLLANQWPSKPLRVVVNFPSGSSPDVVARAVAAPLSDTLGQPVVVENRAGAGGLIGAAAVAKAQPDGYTLLMSPGSSLALVPNLATNMGFDPHKDLIPVAGGARIEMFLLVRNDLPFEDFNGMLAYAKQRPGELKFASPGNGTTPHIAGEMLKSGAGIDALHVPYKGSGAVLQDLLGGRVDFVFDPGVGLPHVRSGRLRLLGVGSRRRLQLFPDVPTLHELGLRGFEVGTTHAFYGPAGISKHIVERLHEAINAGLRLPRVQASIRALGAEPSTVSISELVRISREDSQRVSAVLRSSKITIE